MSATWDGYIFIRKSDHPFAAKNKYVAEHRLVMEHKIGRYLTKEECVHHINGIRNDNRIENLELCTTHGQHTMLHHPELYERLKVEFKGKNFSPKTNFMKGDTRLMGNKFRVGKPSPNKGKVYSEEFKAKLRIAHIGKHTANKTSFVKGQKPWNKGKS